MLLAMNLRAEDLATKKTPDIQTKTINQWVSAFFGGTSVEHAMHSSVWRQVANRCDEDADLEGLTVDEVALDIGLSTKELEAIWQQALVDCKLV